MKPTEHPMIFELTRKEKEFVEEYNFARFAIKIVVAIVVFLLAIFWGWRYISPHYTLYQAGIERRVQVEDAEARADAAEFLANEERVRAQGVADANEIIAASITEEYIRWLYVDQLDQIEGQVIYIPTEAGLPILEAGARIGE